MDGSVHLGFVHAVPDETLERVQHHFLDLLGIFGCDVLQARAKHRLAKVVLEPASVGHRGAELRIDQSFAKRRCGVAEQHL